MMVVPEKVSGPRPDARGGRIMTNIYLKAQGVNKRTTNSPGLSYHVMRYVLLLPYYPQWRLSFCIGSFGLLELFRVRLYVCHQLCFNGHILYIIFYYGQDKKWPPQSPGVVVIESVWDYMRHKDLRRLHPQRICGLISECLEQPTCFLKTVCNYVNKLSFKG